MKNLEGHMCLDDYQLSAYIDNQMSSLEFEKAKKHLNKCKVCFEKVYFLENVLHRENLIKNPEPKKTMHNLTLFIKKKTIEVLKKIGDIKTKNLELSYRNASSHKTPLLEISTNDIIIYLENKNNQLLLSTSIEVSLKILNEKKRVIFAGKANSTSQIPINTKSSYCIYIDSHEIPLQLEFTIA